MHGGWSKNYEQKYYDKQLELYNFIKSKYEGKNIDILEIGVFDGSSGLLMLMALDNITITGIDICENDYPETSTNILNKYFDNIYELIKGSSIVKVNEFKLGKLFDIIHIDADHNFHVVSQDIINCIRLCQDETIWIFDDIDNKGVKNALLSISWRYIWYNNE